MAFKVYRFQKCAFLLTLHGVDSNNTNICNAHSVSKHTESEAQNISIDTFVTLAKKQTKMVFSTEDLVMVTLCNRGDRLTFS